MVRVINNIMRRTIQFILLTLLVSSVSAVEVTSGPGLATAQWWKVIGGPITYAVLSCLVLGCAWAYFVKRQISVVLYGFAAIIFLASMRGILISYLAPDASDTNAIGVVGTFGIIDAGPVPYYGHDTSSLQIAGQSSSYTTISAYVVMGAHWCWKLMRGLLYTAVPLAIALAGSAWVTYRASKGEVVSMLKYFGQVVFVVTFALIPTTYFSSTPNLTSSSVMKVLAGVSNDATITQLQSGTGNQNSPFQIPMLPALIMVEANDLAEGLGRAIADQPKDSYARNIARAAQASRLPAGWLKEYNHYTSICGASARAYVEQEAAAMRSSIISTAASTRRYEAAQNMFSLVPTSGMNGISPWGDLLTMGIAPDAVIVDEQSDLSSEHWLTSKDWPLKRIESSQMADFTAGNIPAVDQLKGVILPPFKAQVIGEKISEGTTEYRVVPDSSLIMAMPNLGPINGYYHYPFYAIGKALLADNLGVNDGLVNGAVNIRYCSVPRTGTGEIFGGVNGVVTIPAVPNKRTPDNYSGTTGTIGDGIWVNIYGHYTEYINSIVQGHDASGGYKELKIIPWDWSEQIRRSLIAEYSWNACLAASQRPDDSRYWGCLVTGQFRAINTADPTLAKDAAKTQEWFDQQDVPDRLMQLIAGVGIPPANGGAPASGAPTLWQATRNPSESAPSLGNFNAVRTTATTTSSSYQDIRIAADIIMAAEGSSNQVSAGGAPIGEKMKLNNGERPGLSFWDGFWEILMKLPLMLIGWLAIVLSMVVDMILPHFMGATMMIYLILYPFFALWALWPGKWTVLFGWIMPAAAIMFWPIPITLGKALMDSSAYESVMTSYGGSGSISMTDIMTIIGASMCLFAPVIVNVIISPSAGALNAIGGAVFSTGFKVVGFAAAILAAVGAAAAAAAAAVGGAVVGGAAVAKGATAAGAGTGAATNTGAAAADGATKAGGAAAQGGSLIAERASQAAAIGEKMGSVIRGGAGLMTHAASVLGAGDLASGYGSGDAAAGEAKKAAAPVAEGARTGATMLGASMLRSRSNKATAEGVDPMADGTKGSGTNRVLADVMRGAGAEGGGGFAGTAAQGALFSAATATASARQAEAHEAANTSNTNTHKGRVKVGRASEAARMAHENAAGQASQLAERDPSYLPQAAYHHAQAAHAAAQAERFGDTRNPEGVIRSGQAALGSVRKMREFADRTGNTEMREQAEVMEAKLQASMAGAYADQAQELTSQAQGATGREQQELQRSAARSMIQAKQFANTARPTLEREHDKQSASLDSHVAQVSKKGFATQYDLESMSLNAAGMADADQDLIALQQIDGKGSKGAGGQIRAILAKSGGNVPAVVTSLAEGIAHGADGNMTSASASLQAAAQEASKMGLRSYSQTIQEMEVDMANGGSEGVGQAIIHVRSTGRSVGGEDSNLVVQYREKPQKGVTIQSPSPSPAGTSPAGTGPTP